MESCDLLIEFLGQQVHLTLLILVIVFVQPEIDLGKHLICEGAGHDERGVTSGAAQVHQATTGQHDDAVAVWEHEAVNLVLDVLNLDARVALESSHVDLIVEVTNVANDGVVLHLGHVGGHNDAEVSSGSDEDVGSADDR